MRDIMSNRKECKRVVSRDYNGESRYIFVKGSDIGKEILITTQLYDIP